MSAVLSKDVSRIAQAMAWAEKSFENCVLVSDPGTGHDDAVAFHVLTKPGTRVMVVPHAGTRCWADRLAADRPVHEVTGFDGAVRAVAAMKGADGALAVVSDSAANMMATLMTDSAAETLVYMDLEELKLPSSRRIRAATTWFCVTSLASVERHQHRGHVRDVLDGMAKTGGYSLVRGTEFPATRDLRITYGETLYNDSEGARDGASDGAWEGTPEYVVSRAMELGEAELALRAYPGAFVSEAPGAIGADECPVCYGAPTPAAVCSSCCHRAFCLGCLGKSLCAGGGACPWCRARISLSNTCLVSPEPAGRLPPTRRAAAVSAVEAALDRDAGARVLLVVDDFFDEGLRRFAPAYLRGGADGVWRAVKRFKEGCRLVVGRTDGTVSTAVRLDGITTVVFGSHVSARDENKWVATTGAFWHHSMRPLALWGRRLEVIFVVPVSTAIRFAYT
jgi:hypothetical protein